MIGTLTATIWLLAWALAALVYLTRPSAPQNRLLGLLLFVEGFNGLGGTLLYWNDGAAEAYAGQAVVNAFPLLMLPALYMLLLGTLDSPLSGPLRRRPVRVALGALALGLPLVQVVAPAWIIHGLAAVPYARWDAAPGPGFWVLFLGFGAVSLLALAVAITAMRRATDPVPRDRAKWFAIAFGTRDALAIGVFAVAFMTFEQRPELSVWASSFGWASVFLIYYPLLAYAILRHQVLGIDLRVKRGLSRTTVAATIAGTAFVGSELIEQAFGVDQMVPALALAAVAALALRPLVRFGNRFADRLMPGVADTKEYRSRRAREIYWAAVASARRDGEVTDKERDVLSTLAKQLGLSPTDVRAIEKGVG